MISRNRCQGSTGDPSSIKCRNDQHHPEYDITTCPREESNLRTRFRKPMLYPLSYEGEGRTVEVGSSSCRLIDASLASRRRAIPTGGGLAVGLPH